MGRLHIFLFVFALTSSVVAFVWYATEPRAQIVIEEIKVIKPAPQKAAQKPRTSETAGTLPAVRSYMSAFTTLTDIND